MSDDTDKIAETAHASTELLYEAYGSAGWHFATVVWHADAPDAEKANSLVTLLEQEFPGRIVALAVVDTMNKSLAYTSNMPMLEMAQGLMQAAAEDATKPTMQ